MVFYDFIEIGTSDFDTLIQEATDDTIGLSIEPIRKYLDNLPNKKNCIKYNCAVSDQEGTIDLYYVPDIIIEQYNFPEWVRGCNSVNSPHPTVVNFLKKLNLDLSLIKMDKVPVVDFKHLVKKFNITGIYKLKIDTEGHDITILKNYVKYCKKHKELLAHDILFESNILSRVTEISNMILELLNLGYEILTKSDADTHMILNINRVFNQTDIYSNEINNYYLFGYPEGYTINPLPHDNTLEDAKKWCIENECGGITYQYGRYEVRKGTLLKYGEGIKSWIRM